MHQLDKLNLSCLAQWLEDSVYNRGVASSSPDHQQDSEGLEHLKEYALLKKTSRNHSYD